MFIFESALQTLKKYADFNGRASRHEFWCFFAFVVIAPAIAGFIGLFFRVGAFLSGLVGLLLFVPQLAVAVRRLHDIGKSGRELFVPLIMLLAMPLAFAFGGILPKIVALGFFRDDAAGLRQFVDSVPEEGVDRSQSLRRSADRLFIRGLIRIP